MSCKTTVNLVGEIKKQLMKYVNTVDIDDRI